MPDEAHEPPPETARYQALFDRMDEGFAVIEFLRDAAGNPADFRYVELNRATERHTGIPVDGLLGRRISDVLPPGQARFWIEAFGQVLKTQDPARLEHHTAALDRWFTVNVTPFGGDRLALIYEDVTDRRRVEDVLRDSEERQAFLLRLSDALRAEPDVDAVANRAVTMLAEHMGLDRCYVTIYRPAEDDAIFPYQVGNDTVPPLPPKVRLSDFPEAYEQVRHGTFVVDDDFERRGLTEEERANSRSLGMRAMLASTVRRGRGNPLSSMMAVSSRPRHWTPAEVRLVEEAAERTWIAMEHSRTAAALREGAALQSAQAKAFQAALAGSSLQECLAALLEAASARFGDVRGAFCTVEPDGAALHLVSGMTEDYARDLRDFPVGADSIACGLAAATGRPVITADVLDEPLWNAWRWLAGRHGFRGVWSFPVQSAAGPPLGTFALYFAQPRAADDADRAFAESLAKAAAIIMSRQQEATERAMAQHALKDSEERLRSFGEASSDVLWIRNAETLEWDYLSPAFEQIYGLSRQDALSGDTLRNWLDLILPEDRARAKGEIERVRRGEQVTFEYRITRPVDGEVRLLRNTDFPMRDAEGKVTRIGGVGHDATDEQANAERLKVLVLELQHRTRNLLGVVQGVMDKTAATSDTMAVFQKRMRDRLGALSRVNGLLSRLGDSDRITFDELIRTELEGHGVFGDDSRVHLGGPENVRLPSSQVQTLALGLHELATNALKYGALSDGSGRLDIRWWLVSAPDGGPRLGVEWRESGVAISDQDAGRHGGYGRELIEKALPYQLKAETSYDLTPDGVRCTITLPLSSTQGDDAP